MASFSAGVSGQVVLGVMKWVVVRHSGHVRSACNKATSTHAGALCSRKQLAAAVQLHAVAQRHVVSLAASWVLVQDVCTRACAVAHVCAGTSLAGCVWRTGPRQLTVFASTSPVARQLRMQPRQKEWSQAMRPNRRCDISGLLMTCWMVGWLAVGCVLQADGSSRVRMSQSKRAISCSPLTCRIVCDVLVHIWCIQRQLQLVGRGSTAVRQGRAPTQESQQVKSRTPSPGICRTLCCCPSHAWRAWPPGPHTRPGELQPPGCCRGAAHAACRPAGRRSCGNRRRSVLHTRIGYSILQDAKVVATGAGAFIGL